MKKYENPSLEIKKLDIYDVISISNPGVEQTPDDGEIGDETTSSAPDMTV